MPQTKLPITAITGFLGSGKTTLLQYLLTAEHGLNIGVVVNDYGDINIDSQLVAEQTDEMMELTNGCICCTLDSMELDEAIAQFSYPGSKIDYVVIEASGLAEPDELAPILRRAAGSHAYLDGVIGVLDAANLQLPTQPNSIAERQVTHSDFVIINKADIASAEQLTAAEQLIREVNPRARTLIATRGQVDFRLLLDQSVSNPDNDAAAGHAHHEGHTHTHYRTISFRTDKPLDPIAFQHFVNHQLPVEVYRAKGIVNLGTKGQHRRYIFQLVGKRAELNWDEWGNETPRTELVFIGKKFNSEALIEKLNATIDTQPQATPITTVSLPKRHR